MRLASGLLSSVALALAATAAAADLPEIPERFRDAAAVVLEDRQLWTIAPTRYATYEVHERTLILDPRGYGEANRRIVYDADNEVFRSFKARAIQSNGDISEVSEDLIHDVVLFKAEGVEVRGRQFTFPAVGPGTVLELSYRIHEKSPQRRRVWAAQREIPVLDTSFSATLKLPAHVVPLHFYPTARGLADETCEITGRQDRAGARSTKLAMRCRNLPALELEPSSPPLEDIRVRVDFLWGHDNIIRDSWDARAGYWYGKIREFTQGCVGCAELAREITRDSVGEHATVDRILDWIRRNLETRAEALGESGGAVAIYYDSPDEVIENRGGWPNEITLLAKVLLEQAGLRTSPILVADRSQGQFVYGALDSPDHLMLLVGVDGERIVLDPSCAACTPGIVDWRFVDPAGPSGVTLTDVSARPLRLNPIPAAFNAEKRTERVTLHQDGAARVSGDAIWSGQLSVDLRRRWAGMSESARTQDFLSHLVGDLGGPTVRISDPADALEPLSAEYAFDSGVRVLPDGSMMIRPASIVAERLRIPIQEERRLPLWFPFPQTIDTTTVFELPPGYRVELPGEMTRLSGPGVKYQGGWSNGNDAREVVWRERLTLGATQIVRDEYEQAREFARALQASLRDGLVARPRALQSRGTAP